jgi:thioredoxin 1
MEMKINDDNFEQEILKESLPVLVDFWAPWCGPCLRLAPVIEHIGKEYKGKLKVCKLNVDEAPQAASRYEIRGIPTLAIFKNGKVVDKIVGALPRAELEAAIKPHV